MIRKSMPTLWAIKIKTVFSLGLKEVFAVGVYRVSMMLGIHPVCRIRSVAPLGPYFTMSDDLILEHPAVSSWFKSSFLFGYISLPLEDSIPNWLSNPMTGVSTDVPLKHWWKMSDFSEKTGDIKLVWEQSRMDWCVAFAQRSRNGDQLALSELNDWLSDWVSKNPPYFGPNWRCGQESSIRVINLACASIILGVENPLKGLRHLIIMHLRRISPTIQYAMAQNNNHGTSEAAALFIGGSWLKSLGIDEGNKWEKQGRSWLENRASKLIEQDGSFSQYSLNYHRMMLDTYSFSEVWRRRLGLATFSPNLYSKLSLATNWLYQLVDPLSGDGPNLGGNDGSKLLQLTDSHYRDYRPSIQLAMTLFENRLAYPNTGFLSHHLAWLDVLPGKGKANGYKSTNFNCGGYKLMRHGHAKAILRFPNFRYRPSQCDALHLDLWVADENLLCDAGSYSYNSDPDLSWYFGGAAGHNTVQFDSRDQMPKISRFLFGSWLRPSSISEVVDSRNGSRCSAGYIDLMGCKHEREVFLKDGSIIVFDNISGIINKATLRWRLAHYDWEISQTDNSVEIVSGDHSLAVSSKNGLVKGKLVDGWKSLFYTDKQPISVLEVEIFNDGEYQTLYQWSK